MRCPPIPINPFLAHPRGLAFRNLSVEIVRRDAALKTLCIPGCPWQARKPYVDGPRLARCWQLRRVWSVTVICPACVMRLV